MLLNQITALGQKSASAESAILASSLRVVALTDIEVDALQLMAEGCTYKEIAHVLNISVSSVKSRLRNARDKLGAVTVAQSLAIACCLQLVAPTQNKK